MAVYGNSDHRPPPTRCSPPNDFHPCDQIGSTLAKSTLRLLWFTKSIHLPPALAPVPSPPPANVAASPGLVEHLFLPGAELCSLSLPPSPSLKKKTKTACAGEATVPASTVAVEASRAGMSPWRGGSRHRHGAGTGGGGQEYEQEREDEE